MEGISTTAYGGIILQAFNWKYSDVTQNSTSIAEAGYKKVLISPAMKSSGQEWYWRYQPQDLRIIDSPLGNKQDLAAMIIALQGKGVEVYADVVLNHMANEAKLRNDLNYPSNDILSDYVNRATYFENQKLYGDLSLGLFSRNDFNPAGRITDWNNPEHVQYLRLCGDNEDTGLPVLNPNGWVVSQQKLYLQALKDMGIKGFRIDSVKHMTPDHIREVFTTDITSGIHVFGEVITSGGKGDIAYDTFLAPYLNNTNHSAYDFPLFSQIRSAFSLNGGLNLLHDPQMYGQALPDARAITFTITHDIPNNKEFRYQIMDRKDEELAYAYILGKDGGTPLIYSDGLPDNEDQDDGRWTGVWNDSKMVSMIGFHNAMQSKPMTMLFSDKYSLLFKRGKEGIVVINKCGEERCITVDTYKYEFNWYVDYKDVLSDAKEVINSRYHEFTIPGRTARLYKLKCLCNN